MPKARVYELAWEYKVDSRTVLAVLADLGEFTRSASSTVEAPIGRRLRSELDRRAGMVLATTPRPMESGDRVPRSSSRERRQPENGPARALTLTEEAEALRPHRRNSAPTEREIRRRWAERMFEPAEIRDWRAIGLGPSDDGLAEQCRDAGLVPEDLRRVVDGLRVIQWLTSGESAVVVRSRLRDQAAKAVG